MNLDDENIRRALAPLPPRRVQRLRTKGWKMPENTVYVGRPTQWGNPFVLAAKPTTAPPYDGYRTNVDLWTGWPVPDRHTAVRAFREMKAPHLRRADLATLRGKNLACWCPLDQPCHADVLLELANAPSDSR